MCHSVEFHLSFLFGTERTLSEYLSLFRKAIYVDVFLAILIPATGSILQIADAVGDEESSHLLSPSSITLVVLLVLVTMIFVIDAILVAYYKSMVENAAEHMNQTALDADNLLKWLYICLGSATTGLVLYAARILVEIYFSFCIDHNFSPIWYFHALPMTFFGLKAVSMASIRTFGHWIREHRAVQAKSNRENAV